MYIYANNARISNYSSWKRRRWRFEVTFCKTLFTYSKDKMVLVYTPIKLLLSSVQLQSSCCCCQVSYGKYLLSIKETRNAKMFIKGKRNIRKILWWQESTFVWIFRSRSENNISLVGMLIKKFQIIWEEFPNLFVDASSLLTNEIRK